MAHARTRKQIITAVGTFTVALSIGFAMQYGDAVAGRWGQDEPVTGPTLRDDAVIVPVAANMAVPTTLSLPESAPRRISVNRSEPLVADVATPSMIVPTAQDQIILAAATSDDDTTEQSFEVAPAAPVIATPVCETTMTATPGDLAMVTLDIKNPCRPNAVVAIHHQGMMFNATTGADGALSVDVPALAKEAFFIAAYDDGEGTVAMTGVPSLALYDRAVLQWQGSDAVQLHALEYGAGYGEDGHIWSGATADRAAAIAGMGGFMTRFGEDNAAMPLKAEVYTFPTGLALQEGEVVLSVEAEITDYNCGRMVEAQGLQVRMGEQSDAVDLVMTLPACDAVGEFLVLKNMFEDLTLAAR